MRGAYLCVLCKNKTRLYQVSVQATDCVMIINNLGSGRGYLHAPKWVDLNCEINGRHAIHIIIFAINYLFITIRQLNVIVADKFLLNVALICWFSFSKHTFSYTYVFNIINTYIYDNIFILQSIYCTKCYNVASYNHNFGFDLWSIRKIMFATIL